MSITFAEANPNQEFEFLLPVTMLLISDSKMLIDPYHDLIE